MLYYEVLVGDLRYHGKEALTYAHTDKLLAGTLVRIALRERSVLGIVLREVPEPSFEAKPIAAVAPATLPAETLELLRWLRAYYPTTHGAAVRQFLPPDTIFPRKVHEAEVSVGSRATLPPLTPAQEAALNKISPSGYHLLHGITGSGKTRIYLELALRTLKTGRSCIILTPEIGLTAQLVQSFMQNIANHLVYVLHSRQTTAERRAIWYAVTEAKEPVVIIGPRSALFAPVQSVGLMVLDESHDQAYKNESAPHYRTERVAAKLAELHKACLVSGSATPSVEEYYMASAKDRPIVELNTLATENHTQLEPPTVVLSDMRDRSLYTESPVLSNKLIEATRHALANGEQVMLFLNRRGTAGAILCNSCGWRAMCPHCDLPLTYHGDTHIMRCHVCGRHWRLPNDCPECHNTDIVLKTVGTKAVADEVKRLFTDARIGRFDSDTHKSEQLEKQLSNLKAGAIDIIIGTQMITKGLDLPKLSVVGVLNADSSLAIPDYSANERTYQLLAQVFGRVGRGHRAGTIFVQTYAPEHPVLRVLTERNWHAFYEQELAERKQFHYPPFVFLLKLSCVRASAAAAQQTAEKLKTQLEALRLPLHIEGPSPAFHPRESGKYKWQLIVKSPRRSALVEILETLPTGWSHDIDPVTLL